jgi:hypothetical protein
MVSSMVVLDELDRVVTDETREVYVVPSGHGYNYAAGYGRVAVPEGWPNPYLECDYPSAGAYERAHLGTFPGVVSYDYYGDQDAIFECAAGRCHA